MRNTWFDGVEVRGWKQYLATLRLSSMFIDRRRKQLHDIRILVLPSSHLL